MSISGSLLDDKTYEIFIFNSLLSSMKLAKMGLKTKPHIS